MIHEVQDFDSTPVPRDCLSPEHFERVLLDWATDCWGVGKRSGRHERRRLQASTRLADYFEWPGLAQVCRIVHTTRRGGTETIEVDYAVTSAPRDQATAATLLAWWRGHWGIENRTHYVRDVTLDEDACRIRTGDAPKPSGDSQRHSSRLLRLEGHANIPAGLRACTWKTQQLLAKLGIVKK